MFSYIYFRHLKTFLLNVRTLLDPEWGLQIPFNIIKAVVTYMPTHLIECPCRFDQTKCLVSKYMCFALICIFVFPQNGHDGVCVCIYSSVKNIINKCCTLRISKFSQLIIMLYSSKISPKLNFRWRAKSENRHMKKKLLQQGQSKITFLRANIIEESIYM